MWDASASQNEAGDNFVEMSMSMELGILYTMWRTGGPPYCGLAGRSECVKKVVTCWKLSRKLQLIPAAHPRDHFPVLVVLALRMRSVGQDQPRTRWDFDRIGIALQQGSEERESFLKELDKNLLGQSVKFEKALTAPAADDSWEFWIQSMVETGKKFFSHTKALHTTEEARRANFERWDLQRRRQRLRQQLGETAATVDAHPQQPWIAFHFRIRKLGRKLWAASRRAQAQAGECMLAELQEAAQQGAKAKVHRLCVQLARNGRGVKGRRYTHVAAPSPSLEEARSWLEEGGMSAKNHPDFDSEVRKVLACFDLASLADLNKDVTARKDLRETLRTLKKDKKVMARVECASGVVHHGFGSTVLCCGVLNRFHMGLALTRESVLR